MVVPSFTWIPSWQTQEQSEPRTRLADLTSAISVGSDGNNTDLKTWNVILENRLHDEALAIDSFLASRGGVEPFEWSNPRSLSKLYVCEQWDSVVNAKATGSDDIANRIWTITASFREVTEAGGDGALPPGFRDITGTISTDGLTAWNFILRYTLIDKFFNPSTGTFTCRSTFVQDLNIYTGTSEVAYFEVEEGAPFVWTGESCGGNTGVVVYRVTRSGERFIVVTGASANAISDTQISLNLSAATGTAADWRTVWPA